MMVIILIIVIGYMKFKYNGKQMKLAITDLSKII